MPASFTPLTPDEAAKVLRRGGVIAYPTEAVWGLGCDPFDETAVMRLLAIKQRPVDKGVILIAGTLAQFCERYPRGTLHFVGRRQLPQIATTSQAVRLSSPPNSCQKIKG